MILGAKRHYHLNGAHWNANDAAIDESIWGEDVNEGIL